MKRLRLLRVVVPLALIAFVIVVVLAFRERPPAPGEDKGPGTDGTRDGALLKGFTISDIVGDKRRLAVSARMGSWNVDGGFQAEGIDRIELDREGESPLIVSAAKGRGSGPQGRRLIQLEGQVEIRDEENGFLVKIPGAELDQGAGLARSIGDVAVIAPGASGTATSAVYPLDGRPTEIYGVELRDNVDGVLRAGKALLPRGGASATFEGGVKLIRGADALDADRIVVKRDDKGAIESAEAAGAVRGSATRKGAPAMRFRAAHAVLNWKGGEIADVSLTGDVLVEQADRTLQGRSVEVIRRGAGWNLAASGSVVLTGAMPSGTGYLEAASLQADVDAAGAIERGHADGGVRFTGKDTAGDGDSAELVRMGSDDKLTVRAGAGRRARLAAGRTRVAADTIVTTGRGTRMQAEGKVEATLLPEPGSASGAGKASLFNTREAIHFVSARLEAEESGKVLRLRDSVRGWQADRNLSTDSLDIDQRSDALDANGRVTTRSPRESGGAMRGGFLTVTSDHLRYRGREGIATYEGSVRARQDEGWITCARLEVILAEAGGKLREVRGFEGVRLEFRAPPAAGSATSEPVNGRADRLVYALDTGLVRLFGDRAPAEVQRGGPNGGTTAGRVLRYELQTGHIEVESGAGERSGSAQGSR